MSDRVSRKELLKQDDAFTAAANQGVLWLAENRKAVIGLAVGLFVGTAAVIGGREFMTHRNSVASEAYEAARTVSQAKIVTPDEASPNADPPTYGSETDRDKAARDKFKEAASHGGPVGTLSRFYVATLSEKLGEDDAAISELTSLMSALGTDDSLYFLAVERAAYLKEKKGDLDGAMQLWERLVHGDKGFYGDRSRYQEARLALQKGDTTRARNLLEAVQKDFPESALKDSVKAQLAALGASPKPLEPIPNAPTGASAAQANQGSPQ